MRSSSALKLAVYALLLGLAAFVVASLAGFWVAVRPPRLAVPLRLADYRLEAEEVTVRADDGVALTGWFVPRRGAPAVILLHGYPADKADMLPLAAGLAPRFAVLLLDQRYFGGSGGRATTLGLRERGDLKRAVDFVESRGARAVGVFGLSLGGAVALTTAAEEPRIRAVVAYAPFADLGVLGHELYAWTGPLKYPLVATMRLWSRLFLGDDITRPSPEQAARALTIPVLLIHSRGDEQIPFRHAERLREALASNRRAEFELMERGRHGELPRGIDGRLTRFYSQHLR